MNNPIKSYEQIHQDFALYMRTAYGTKYDTVEAERRTLFEAPFDDNAQSFHRLPWLEALPRYQNIGKKLTDLPSGASVGLMMSSVTSIPSPRLQDFLAMISLSIPISVTCLLSLEGGWMGL